MYNPLYSQDSTLINGKKQIFYLMPTDIKTRNIIYIMPTALIGDNMTTDLDIIWLVMGYDHRITKTNFVGVNIGAIISSKDVTANNIPFPYGSFISSNKTTGVNMSLEHKIILRKKFYYSTNLFYQHTKTYCPETVYTSAGFVSYSHQYYVNRDVVALTPKIGFMFINKHHLFTDFSVGVGIRYITSHTFDKVGALSTTAIESITGKPFEYGSAIKPNYLIQIKIGYNF